MQKYILLSSLTTLGRRTLKERPARMKEVDTEIRAMGIKREKFIKIMKLKII